MSITKQLWVINRNSEGVRTNIHVKGTANGSIKLNIDGKPGETITGKEIRGNDSIVIFVQIYSNADNNYIVNDQIVFETNGNVQTTNIIAFGRDAHYHEAETWDTTTTSIFWSNDKPHVIYNSILIEKGQTLTINPGTKIYSHINSSIYVRGTLIVNGSSDNPVIFNGDRMDADYANITGQWIGLHILPGSINNVIKGSIIKNGFVGIEVDSASINSNPNLTIKQSIIQNMKAAGIVGFSANIKAENNLISDCGQYSFYGVLGGNYTLTYNTLACYNSASSRSNAQVILDNTPYDDGKGTVIKFPLLFNLTNNIIWGTEDDELTINNNPDGDQSTTGKSINFNLLKTTITGLETFNNVINQDPLFTDYTKMDYTVLISSPAKGKATNQTGIFTDIKNQSRNSSTPTIGAYE